MIGKNSIFIRQKLDITFFIGKMCIFATESKKEGKDQESIQSNTTPDPGYKWESDNFTIRHHKREPRGQPFHSRWPQSLFLGNRKWNFIRKLH